MSFVFGCNVNFFQPVSFPVGKGLVIGKNTCSHTLFFILWHCLWKLPYLNWLTHLPVNVRHRSDSNWIVQLSLSFCVITLFGWLDLPSKTEISESPQSSLFSALSLADISMPVPSSAVQVSDQNDSEGAQAEIVSDLLSNPSSLSQLSTPSKPSKPLKSSKPSRLLKPKPKPETKPEPKREPKPKLIDHSVQGRLKAATKSFRLLNLSYWKNIKAINSELVRLSCLCVFDCCVVSPSLSLSALCARVGVLVRVRVVRGYCIVYSRVHFRAHVNYVTGTRRWERGDLSRYVTSDFFPFTKCYITGRGGVNPMCYN
jgi:hypothetical protein